MRKRYLCSKILILFSALTILSSIFPNILLAQTLVWEVTSAVGDARSITQDDNYLYVAGESNDDWCIEKHRKSDGGLEWTQTSSPSARSDKAMSITSDNSYLYIVGNELPSSGLNTQWRIEKRRKIDNGFLEWTQTFRGSGAYITNDDDYLYIAGGGTSNEWRVQKRHKSNGELIWTDSSSDGDGS